MSSFKPSEVALDGSYPPLVATFERTECEFAGALLVLAMSKGDDAFRAIAYAELTAAVRAAADVDLWKDMFRNPYLNPDFHGLVDRGFARWLPGDFPAKRIEFTDAGIAALQRWRRPSAEGGV